MHDNIWNKYMQIYTNPLRRVNLLSDHPAAGSPHKHRKMKNPVTNMRKRPTPKARFC